MRHPVIGGLLMATAAVISASVSSAQERATLLMRSGERVAGQLIDMSGIGFTISVAGDERQVPLDEVAEIEFGDPAQPVGETGGSGAGRGMEPRPAVWLRNGEIVEGQLYDIDGGRPLRITLKSGSGQREFSSSEIRKIVLAAAPPVGTAGTTSKSLVGIDVPGNSTWVPTGIVVRSGEVVTFSTTGQIQLGADAENIAGASGARSQRSTADAPVPAVAAGALIAKIDDGVPFPIADATSATMPAAGQLFLGINDARPAGNTGSFRVTIQRPPVR